MQISTAPDCAGTFKVTAGDAMFEVKATTARTEEKTIEKTIEKKKTDRLESGV